MVRKTSTIKGHFFNASRLGFFSHTLANHLCGGDVATLASSAQGLANLGFGSRGRRQAFAAVARNHARIDVQIGAIDREPRNPLCGDPDAGLTRSAKTLFFFGQHVAAPYFFLVSLIVTFSSA